MWFHSPCEHDLRSDVPDGQSSRPARPAHARAWMAMRTWMRVRWRWPESSFAWRRCATRSIAVVIRGRCRCGVSRAIREHGIGKRKAFPYRIAIASFRSGSDRDAGETPYRRRSTDAPFVAGLRALRVHSVLCRGRPSRAHRTERRAPAVASAGGAGGGGGKNGSMPVREAGVSPAAPAAGG